MFLCNLQIFLLFLIEFPKIFVSLQHFNSSNYGKYTPPAHIPCDNDESY